MPAICLGAPSRIAGLGRQLNGLLDQNGIEIEGDGGAQQGPAYCTRKREVGGRAWSEIATFRLRADVFDGGAPRTFFNRIVETGGSHAEQGHIDDRYNEGQKRWNNESKLKRRCASFIVCHTFPEQLPHQSNLMKEMLSIGVSKKRVTVRSENNGLYA